jgi:3'-phosphoadenosine 5'-phosphosulfate sulfotransferase (PAPS reductase)/FAD synthetase
VPKPEILNLISYSGGKDSGAMALHLLERGERNLVLVMCDTHWEAEETERYAQEFAKRTGLRLVLLDSEGMVALCIRKKRAPSMKARFCTEELKRKPFAAYVARKQAEGFETVIWIGERADESAPRAKKPCDEWDSEYNALVVRPIQSWTIPDVLAIHAKNGIPLNPLYYQGMGRVGCMPCVLEDKAGLAAIAERRPEAFDKVGALEAILGRTFWAPGRTPPRFCSKRVWVEATPEKIRKKDGKVIAAKPARWVPLATAADVRTWALTAKKQAPGQLVMFPEPKKKCQSRWALCE